MTGTQVGKFWCYSKIPDAGEMALLTHGSYDGKNRTTTVSPVPLYFYTPHGATLSNRKGFEVLGKNAADDALMSDEDKARAAGNTPLAICGANTPVWNYEFSKLNSVDDAKSYRSWMSGDNTWDYWTAAGDTDLTSLVAAIAALGKNYSKIHILACRFEDWDYVLLKDLFNERGFLDGVDPTE
ncbi:MAG: hypothetical protein KF914_17410 [Rhizobiaceae bacterium]|nr:hypothetical protein [Rhizobiaceae bacterium]